MAFEGADETLDIELLLLEQVAGRHEVVEVDVLDEGLDADALGDAFVGHRAGDLSREAADSSDQGVAEFSVF